MLDNKPLTRTNFPPHSYSKYSSRVTIAKEANFPADIYWHRSHILKLWFIYNAQVAFEYFKRG